MAVMEQSESVEERQVRNWETGYLVLRGSFAPEETEAWQTESERLLRSDIVHPDSVARRSAKTAVSSPNG